MSKKRLLTTLVFLIGMIAVNPRTGFAQTNLKNLAVKNPAEKELAIERTKKLIEEVRALSYPELASGDIDVKTLESSSDFFNARFSFARFLTFRCLKATIFVNPLAFRTTISDFALRAILAHELAHVLYYRARSRFKLLCLVGLANESFRAGFERRTDLVAIARGYGPGLINYRKWLYENVPEKSLLSKKRDYFTPEEIALLIPALDSKPDALANLLVKVPRNIDGVKKATEQ